MSSHERLLAELDDAIDHLNGAVAALQDFRHALLELLDNPRESTT